jgi:DNA-binding NarL/FixJ family response regulator
MPLSEHERATLRQLTQGATNRQIARDLNISEAAVKVRLTSLFRKLDVKNRSQAITWARDNGVLEGC